MSFPSLVMSIQTRAPFLSPFFLAQSLGKQTKNVPVGVCWILRRSAVKIPHR